MQRPRLVAPRPFTIMEWVLAMALLTMLFAGGAAAIPYLLNKERFITACDLLQDKLRFAQKLSEETHKTVGVLLTKEDHSYSCQLQLPENLTPSAQKLLNQTAELKGIDSIEVGIAPLTSNLFEFQPGWNPPDHKILYLKGRNKNLEKYLLIGKSIYFIPELVSPSVEWEKAPTYPHEIETEPQEVVEDETQLPTP